MFPKTTKILIVDDAKAMRRIIMKMFKELGFENLIEAGNGAEGWELIAKPENGIQLVMSDWNMPQSTGLDLLRRVRSDGRKGDLPFLLVTTEAEEHQVKEALASGVDAFVVKPFTAETLVEKLTAVFKKRFGG